MTSRHICVDPNTRIATVIIPLRASRALFQWEQRLSRILSAIPFDLFEVILVDYGSGSECRAQLSDVVGCRPVEVVRVESEHLPFSVAHVRNIGAMAANAPNILFHDVDFIACRGVYEAVAEELHARDLARNFHQFFCLPVVFLTRDASREYISDWSPEAVGRHGAVAGRALREPLATAVSIAYGSSCMVVNRRHYLAIGGHDESFSGHWGEDYEFLHRLSAFSPKGPRPPCYYTDFRDNGIRRYRGFRAAFALHGISLFHRGIFLVHLQHPARPVPGYVQRGRNAQLLRRRMEEFDRTGRHPAPLTEARGDRGRAMTFGGHDRDLERFRATVGAPVAGAMEPLDSDLFRSFGGRIAIERAVRIAALGEALSRDTTQFSGRAAGAALAQLYRLFAAGRAPRAIRVLLRRVPPRYLRSWEAWLERLLLWMADRATRAPKSSGSSPAKAKSLSQGGNSV